MAKFADLQLDSGITRGLQRGDRGAQAFGSSFVMTLRVVRFTTIEPCQHKISLLHTVFLKLEFDTAPR